MEEFTIIQSFFTLDDAEEFFDRRMRQMAHEGWELAEGSNITYVNYQYRVGIRLERKVNENVVEFHHQS